MSKSSVQIFKSEMEAMITAAALARLNAQAITKPGWGKSETVFYILKQVFGDHNLTLECSPTTPAEVIEGAYSPAELLNGKLVKVVDGTPYDPYIWSVLLDEGQRLSEIGFDKLVHALNRIGVQTQPFFVSTSNFVVKSARTEAVRDRFALNFIPSLVMDESSVREVASNFDFEATVYDVPDLAVIEAVRETRPGSQAKQAIENACYDLFEVLAGTQFSEQVNPRRVAQWRKLLFALSVFETGSDDFKAVPPAAMSALRFAMPVMTSQEYAEWCKICMATVDKLGALLEQFRAAAYVQFKDVVAQTDPSDRGALMAKMGEISARAQAELEQYDDPRVPELQAEITHWFTLAAQGKEF